MKTTEPRPAGTRLLVLALAGIATVAGLMPASPAEARERMRTGSYTNARGNSGTFQSLRERSPGSASRSTTWQNSRGEGVAESSRQWDAESGSYSRQRQVTGAAGAQATTQVQGQRNADGSYAMTGSRAGANGHSTDMTRTITPDGEGGASTTTTYARDDGKSLSVEKSLAKSDDGWSRSATVTSPDGRTGSHDVTWSRDGNTLTRNATNTGPGGASMSRGGSLSFESTNP